MAQSFTAIPAEYLEEMEELTDEEYGRLIRALQRYSMTGEAITAEGNERFYAKRVMAQEDRYQANYYEAAQKRANAGKKGAASRWKAEENSPAEDSTAISANGKNGNIETETETEIETETETETDITPLKPPKGGKRGERDADFDRFWAAYPRKVGKEAARKAFAKADVPIDTLLTAIAAQRASPQWRRDDGQYIPHPATWLNQGRWEDEITAPSTPIQSVGQPPTTSARAELERMQKLREQIRRG